MKGMESPILIQLDSHRHPQREGGGQQHENNISA